MSLRSPLRFWQSASRGTAPSSLPSTRIVWRPVHLTDPSTIAYSITRAISRTGGGALDVGMLPNVHGEGRAPLLRASPSTVGLGHGANSGARQLGPTVSAIDPARSRISPSPSMLW